MEYLPLGMNSGGGSQKCGGTKVVVDSTGKVALNKWTHVAAVYTGTKVNIYINEKLDSQHSVSTVDPYTPLHDLWIGKEKSTNPGLDGQMADLQLWSRALTAAEVSQAAKKNVVNKTGLMGHWNLIDGSGSTATDSSGNAHHGTITGASWAKGGPMCPRSPPRPQKDKNGQLGYP